MPTLDELDQSCFIPHEMISVELTKDEDMFIRDEKKGRWQRLIYGVPQELVHDEES